MELPRNGDILKVRLQAIHVHVLLVALLGTGHMAQLSTDQYKGRVAVQKAASHTGEAASRFSPSINGYSSSVCWKITVGLSTSLLNLFSSLLQLHIAYHQFKHVQATVTLPLKETDPYVLSGT